MGPHISQLSIWAFHLRIPRKNTGPHRNRLENLHNGLIHNPRFVLFLSFLALQRDPYHSGSHFSLEHVGLHGQLNHKGRQATRALLHGEAHAPLSVPEKRPRHAVPARRGPMVVVMVVVAFH
ncbi:hypothetical protein G4B88_023370 [Cannabis sativa]|uniref:Uncharacterized protein n=1 Tax=Cannabis sativa TaxID=3483 RepID=A0A7J6HZ46_CANSA|nr:hypothetical protein G4B88_023370 [Cannabis sativa]